MERRPTVATGVAIQLYMRYDHCLMARYASCLARSSLASKKAMWRLRQVWTLNAHRSCQHSSHLKANVIDRQVVFMLYLFISFDHLHEVCALLRSSS